LLDWYRRGVRMSIQRLGLAIPVTIVVFIAALVGGYLIGQIPQWQLHLPQGLPLRLVAGSINGYTGYFFGSSPVLAIAWQNGRILLGAALLAMFTFGAGALILTPAVYIILGYIISQIVIAGYNPSFMIPAILTHGVVEIPVIVLATAAGLHLGAVITRPPRGKTVGQAWTMALGDAVKLALGIIIPGLIIAGALEAYVTPLAIRAALGG
ncbi:MAG: stage II sporulation protein M, partial [Chloroflexota bacterium]